METMKDERVVTRRKLAGGWSLELHLVDKPGQDPGKKARHVFAQWRLVKGGTWTDVDSEDALAVILNEKGGGTV